MEIPLADQMQLSYPAHLKLDVNLNKAQLCGSCLPLMDTFGLDLNKKRLIAY